ncbi:hypothetical protein N4P33_33675 [Streptomyces sp. 15-116A]|uniref:Rv1733c family protein n=1 Tax=Streptomyces sp. 15-116A TaxID=2259035 RepID=UPI0021B3F093|nr:hypothetical protein [Streptomyces sp. 15-116A]MCT7357055.1 hypothetical protein [Streptomyces sp. 15-116A]
MAVRGPGRWLWRWRRNPLKRRADRVESWFLLASWALTLLISASAGAAVSGSVEDALARERAEWRRVQAYLTERAPGNARGDGRDSRADHVWATARWTGADGSLHTGQIRVAAGSGAGTAVDVWTDRRGRQVTRPATVSEARLRARLVGAVAALGAGVVPVAVGRAVCGRLEERRLAEWDAEWARLGPQWGRSAS